MERQIIDRVDQLPISVFSQSALTIPRHCPWSRRVILACLLSILSLLSLPRSTAAQSVMADPPPAHATNPLCSGSLLPCLLFDDFSAHFMAQLQVAPGSAHRDTAVLFPAGVAMHLFGVIGGSLFTTYSFWNQDSVLNHQFGPLELALSGRLYPFRPTLTLHEAEEPNEEPPPPSGLQLGVSFQQELRVSVFSGPNSLGLLTNLAALRAVASRRIWVLEVMASVGALYDWQGAFVVGEGALKVGFRLPFFKQLELFGEGMVRGPVYQNDQKLAALLSPGAMPSPNAAPNQLGSGGCGGLGFAFHVRRRVDFGITVHHCYGDLSPWSISVNALTLSAGEPYKYHPATSIPEMAGTAAQQLGTAIKEFIANLPVDPKLNDDCMIIDKDDVTVIGQFGTQTLDHYYCEKDGFRVPIGHELFRDKAMTKLCRDDKLKDCLLEKKNGVWTAVHRPMLDSACQMVDSDGAVLGNLGEPTADGKHCRYKAERQNGGYGHYTRDEEMPIGERFYTDDDRTAVCRDEAMRQCFMKPPPGQHTLAWGKGERATTAFLGGGVDELRDDGKAVRGVLQSAKDVATGKVKVTTLLQEGEDAVKKVVKTEQELERNPEKRHAAEEAVRKRIAQLQKSIEDWWHKPPEERMEDMARAAGSGGVSLGTGALVGGTMRIAGEGVAAGVDVLSQGAKTAEHVEHVVSDAVKVEKQVAKATPSLEELAKAASELDRGGRTSAGRALQKHGDRPGSAFPKARGTPTQINQAGQQIVDEILSSPGATTVRRHHARFGDVIEVRAPDGRGIRYDSKGNLIGFLEPQ